MNGDYPRVEDLTQWPGADRRDPRLRHHAYLMLAPLRAGLEDARDRYVTPGARILDVGARSMPYYPLFARVAAEYVGNDVEPGPRITIVSPLERLDAESASFDLVLCTQVLEHIRRPDQALAEISRVLRPGGHLFLSTHGVYPHHPDPGDYWRWTQQGFEAIFEDTEGLELVELQPHVGSAATLAMLVAGALRDSAGVGRGRIGVAPLIAGINLLGLGLDKITPRRARERLVGNFMAVGRKAETGF